jgi:two-component system, chemotaxis family, sensor kinase Cph1
VVSHDLRNPLGAIVNMAGALKLLPSDKLGPALDVIDRAAARMNRMINDLLDLANIDAGRFSIALQPHEVGRLVHQALDELRPLASEKTIAVEAHLPPDLPAIRCDGERIVQVLSNLLGNALKYTPRGGSVRISVERCESGVSVAVEDNGPGIAPEDLPHLFQRFYRSPRRLEHGIGLGLAIARAIVEHHQGTITVESQLDAGSRFIFTLPAAPALPAQKERLFREPHPPLS